VARQPVTFFNSKKSNQKCRKLAKFDLEITYSLLDSLIQYTLAAPTRTIFTRPNCSSISMFASSQYHCVAADFSKHNEATTNKFSRLLFILKQVKTVPNGRFVLLSSACRSKKVPPIPLGDKPSGTAGQKTLRDAPVVVKLRR
jgi:hypothetical protein